MKFGSESNDYCHFSPMTVTKVSINQFHYIKFRFRIIFLEFYKTTAVFSHERDQLTNGNLKSPSPDAQLRFLRIFSRCFLRKFLPTNLFLIVQTSVTLTIISLFKYCFFSFFFICSFFLFCFFSYSFFFGFAFSLLAFYSFFSFSPLMYLLSFLFSLIFLFKLFFCYFSWDRSIPENRLKRRKSR